MTRHGTRFLLFALIGGGVFLAGLALQVLLVRYAGLSPDWSYAAQAFFSIELSYLLNRYVTWRDRSAGFWAAAWKFNAQKLLMTVVNLTAYALLERAGLQYLVANVLLTAIFTPVNYFAADLLIFVRGGRSAAAEHTVEPWLPEVLPTVSVVIPCKNSHRTIRATVDALLGQDYPALNELILVGDVGDPTWGPLADITDSRLVLIEQEKTPGRRDPNVKRDKGIKKSRGDVIALADSDIVVDPGWLSRAVALLNGQGGGLVAGGMRSIDDSFWGRFVDNNVLAAKTPRVAKPYRVTAENFGARGCKPPITANAVFTRELYDQCPLDTEWAYGYEDYEWSWRVAKEAHAILYSSDLTAEHHHRRSFRALVREYRQSAHGCAQFIRAHPESPLAKKRAVQAFGLPAVALGGLGLAALAVVTGYGMLMAGLLAVAAVVVTGREVGRVRSLEGLTYPPVAMALGGVYAATIAGNLIRPAPGRAVSTGAHVAANGLITLDRPPKVDDSITTRVRGALSRQRPWSQRVCWPLVAILAVQAGLSLSLAWSNTASSDEGLYLWAGHVEISRTLHHTINAPTLSSYHFAHYFSGAPQIYPVIGAIADSIGGLAGARLLSLAFILGATLLLFSATSRVYGQRAALIAAFVWVTSESAIRMGAYATFDAMAIFFLCLGAAIAIHAGDRRRHSELVALSAVCLAIGGVTAYSYAIYVPPTICVAVLVWARQRGWKRSIISGIWLTGFTCALLAAIPTLLKLWNGVFFTTIARSSISDYGKTSLILTGVWNYGGLAIFAIIAGGIAIVALGSTVADKLLGAALVGTVLLVPIYQTFDARTGWSLDKHMSCGIWLGAMAVGEGFRRVSGPTTSRRVTTVSIAAAAIFPIFNGWYSAYGAQVNWPNETGLISALHRVVPSGGGTEYVDTNPPLMTYYTMPASVGQLTWSDSLSLDPPGSPSKWIGYYRKSLNKGHYGLVVLTFSGTLKSADLPNEVFQALRSPSQQRLVQIASADSSKPGLYDFVLALDNDTHYRLVATGPYSSGFGYGFDPGSFAIWQRVNSPSPVTRLRDTEQGSNK